MYTIIFCIILLGDKLLTACLLSIPLVADINFVLNLFGDETKIKTELKESYKRYTNRYENNTLTVGQFTVTAQNLGRD